ncbi:MAG TPA: MBL fold metallo-hydrolase [Myxococcales bacterium]|jgi:glyoxylase-like metal-dependent hydrolase (beta-lactamase superfamily II)|nr:MBL fold metallo-hydrolase [Myxococcales bacterium]
MAAREILPGIETWQWFSERHGYDFNGYLLRDAGGNVAVDPVEMPAEVLAGLARSGVSRIVLTNRNHFRAAARLKKETGARISVHPADAAFVRAQDVPVDDELAIGARLSQGFEVVDASGKSPGEVALWNAERRVLMVGDACVGKPPGALALLPAKVIDELPRLHASLRRLAELPAEAVLVGDGAPLLRGGQAALRALVQGFA